jgi:hypothetical protein
MKLIIMKCTLDLVSVTNQEKIIKTGIIKNIGSNFYLLIT